jgi:arabinogalactan oligomer/maltooligosaccharide transport system substrate-binding protein
MRRSITTAGIAAATLALTLTACGGDDGSGGTGGGTGGGGGQAAADPAAVSGTVTWWDTTDSTSEAPVYKELVAKFEAQYPKIKVNYVNVPFSDARDKFKNAAQGGTGAPDVMRADVAWTPSFAELGYLQPLDGSAALGDGGKDAFLPAAWNTTQYKGKTYGVPQVTDSLALLYNKELLAKAGITKAPATWAEMKTAALAVKEKTGAAGSFIKPQGFYTLPFIYGEGGSIVDAQNKKITLNDEKAVAGVSIAKDLVDSGAAITDITKDGYTNMQTAFKEGKVAMVINGPWSVSDDYKGPAFANKDNLGIAPVPAGSSGKAGGPTGGHNLVVYAGSKNIAPSELLVKFLTTAENQAFVADKIKVLPTRSAAYTQGTLAQDPVITSFRGVMDFARPGVPVPQAADLWEPFDQQMEKVFGGKASVKSGLDETAAAGRKILPGFN